VFNLLSNAVKFTPKGGSVDVSATRQDGEVLIAVTDTGPGISAEDQGRIFEEFQQAKGDGNAERPEGTGLGLALSKSLVELHGGRIWVESEPGEGSTFTFTIPVGSSS
jgi:signal transduction histidine kinase